MTHTTRIPKAQLSGFYGMMIKRFSRKMFGAVAEPAEVMWHHPAVLKASMSYGRKLQKWDKLDPQLKTFAHMAVAAMVGCSWCLDLNYFDAQHQGLDLAKASEVPRWRESAVFSPQEREVLAYAEAMTLTPPQVTDEQSAHLLELLGAAGMVELTSVVAFANMTTRGNTALGIESQEFSKECPVPLAQPSPRYVASA